MLRKKIIVPVAIALICAFSFQSCIGSFSLTNKVLTWNRNVSNKFVNELVFFVFWVLPVYEVTAAADLLVINSIEFWSGNKPLEAHNQKIKTENGEYEIKVDENGYAIISPDGNILHFIFDAESNMWSFAVNDNDQTHFLKFTHENHAQVIDFNGEFVDVELTRDGVENFKSMIPYPLMALK